MKQPIVEKFLHPLCKCAVIALTRHGVDWQLLELLSHDGHIKGTEESYPFEAKLCETATYLGTYPASWCWAESLHPQRSSHRGVNESEKSFSNS